MRSGVPIAGHALGHFGDDRLPTFLGVVRLVEPPGKSLGPTPTKACSLGKPAFKKMRVCEYTQQRIIDAMMIDPDALVQALADGTRLRALVLLIREESLCVCELTAALDASQPKMSRHLAALRALDLVDDARVANRIFYRLPPDLPDWARGVIERLAQGLNTTTDLASARDRLDRFPNRPLQRPCFARAGAAVDRDRTEIGDAV